MQLKFGFIFSFAAVAVMAAFSGSALKAQDTLPQPVAEASAPQDTLVLTLEDALRIALSENISVKVADQEITRNEYAKKGSYSALFPQISLSGSYQRTIKKQVMYMDGMSGSGGMFGSMFAPIFNVLGQMAAASGVPFDAQEIMAAMSGGDDEGGSSSSGGIEVGRLNTYSAGVTASMPLINFQLWESLRISGTQVDLAVEQARESRLGMVSSVKQAYYGALLAKEAFDVYKSVYENAVENYEQTLRRYNAQKASELEYTRAEANVASAIPNVYTAESNVILALWQLKAVIGIDLDREIDVAGSLSDYASTMLEGLNSVDESTPLDGNTQMRQLALQAEMLATSVRTQTYANLPSLALAFSYSYMAMTNDFKFSEYNWTPYSYVGLQLNIPIFTGFKNRSAVRQARIQQEELDLQKVNAERQLRIGIRQSLQTMETGMKSYASAETAVGLAQKAYDIAKKSYQVGRSTLTDLNDAQLVLTQARLGVSQAIYSYLNAKTSLEQMLGYDFLDEDGNVDLEGSYRQ